MALRNLTHWDDPLFCKALPYAVKTDLIPTDEATKWNACIRSGTMPASTTAPAEPA